MGKHFVSGPPIGFEPPEKLRWQKVPQLEKKTEVCWREEEDLMCSQSQRYPAFFKRHGYHLFNSINEEQMNSFKTEEELLSSETVLAEVYRVALAGMRSPDPRYTQLGLKHSDVKRRPEQCKWWDLNQLKMPWLLKNKTLPKAAKKAQ